MELIIGALIGVCFFIAPLWAYQKGIQDGIAISKDKAIQPIQTPLQAITKHVETKKADKKQIEEMQGINSIMNYDPFAKVKVGE